MPRHSVREKIVETALERFQIQGFNGCGVQDITDAAGVPKGSFYNHFKSKEALAIEVLDRYAAGGRFDLLATPEVPAIDRLKAHFSFFAERIAGWGFERGCLLGNFSTETADSNPAIRAAMADSFERWTGLVAGVIEEARADGAIAERHDPATLARFLVHAFEGAIAGARVARSRRPFDDFFAVAFGTLLA
jgi:TetR/AcrR family transcriptional repressor of nem operon